jgi:Amt family ammonium transporter
MHFDLFLFSDFLIQEEASDLLKTQITLPDFSPSDFKISNLWLLLSAALVFIMNLGFTFVEAGLVRSKNVTNILFKNILIPVISLLVFSGWGLALMFPGEEYAGGFIGLGNPGLPSPEKGNGNDVFSFWTFFFYQVMFASTSATIIVGAVAERMKFLAWIMFTIFFIGFIYPSTGMWYWGKGWLVNLLEPKFYDFAGTAMIHMVGGFGAFTAALILGPRIGKYSDERIMPIPGHNMSLAAIGLFMLWFGWIGFNGGRIMSAEPEILSYVLVCTFLSAASGCAGAFFTSWFANRTHDITMSGNGIIAGLVAISASANIMSPVESLIIGFIAGILVVFSVLLFDKFKIDDPVGAISVHLVCGIWGVLAVGIFGPLANKGQFISQIIGIASIGTWVCVLSLISLFIIKKIHGLRVSQKDELEGLDISRHGMKAYNLDSDNN